MKLTYSLANPTLTATVDRCISEGAPVYRELRRGVAIKPAPAVLAAVVHKIEIDRKVTLAAEG